MYTDKRRRMEQQNEQVNAFTIDVEDYYHVSAFAGVIPRAAWNALESRVVANTRRLLELLGEAGVKATFFVLGAVAERHPALVREIAEQGHEIACHGYSHQLIYEQTPQAFRYETAKAKALLEELGGAPVQGYRAASWSVTKASLWACEILGELGFSYDSSIYPVAHDRYGIPGEQRHIHSRPVAHQPDMVEFPPATMALGPLVIPVGGGGYFRLYPYAVTKAALRWINRREKAPFSFYIHPWEIDPDQPRVEASRLSRFRHYVCLSRCEGRLRRLLRDFRFDTALSVLARAGMAGAPSVAAAAGQG